MMRIEQDLVSLIEHVPSSLRLIEQPIAGKYRPVARKVPPSS